MKFLDDEKRVIPIKVRPFFGKEQDEAIHMPDYPAYEPDLVQMNFLEMERHVYLTKEQAKWLIKELEHAINGNYPFDNPMDSITHKESK